jgi:LysM repeat protein
MAHSQGKKGIKAWEVVIVFVLIGAFIYGILGAAGTFNVSKPASSTSATATRPAPHATVKPTATAKPPVKAPKPVTKPVPKPAVVTYTVKTGDCLWLIGQHYHIAWQKIYAANRSVIGPDPNLIYTGQHLVIRR